MSTTASLSSETESVGNLYRFTVEGIQTALKADVFDHPERIELVQGIVMEKSKPTEGHDYLVNHLSRRLRKDLKKSFLVYGRRPLAIDIHNQPTADLLIVMGAKDSYWQRYPLPVETALVIEIADLPAVYDLGGKANLYANAGITDYWVVLVSENAVVVHRDPTPNGYSMVTRLAGEDTLSPLAAPEAVWTINTLLGRVEAPEEN